VDRSECFVPYCILPLYHRAARQVYDCCHPIDEQSISAFTKKFPKAFHNDFGFASPLEYKMTKKKMVISGKQKPEKGSENQTGKCCCPSSSVPCFE
jgi:hypothetical protein